MLKNMLFLLPSRKSQQAKFGYLKNDEQKKYSMWG